MARDFVSWDDILERAKTISQMTVKEGKQRCDSLIHMMFKQPMDEECLMELRKVAFLPVKTSPVSEHKYFSEDNKICFTSVNDGFYDICWEKIVSFVAPVIDSSIFGYYQNDLKNKLLGQTKPSIETVLDQHQKLFECFQGGDINNSLSMYISTCCQYVYQYLNRDVQYDEELQAKVTEHFKITGMWISENNTFCAVEKCAVQGSKLCYPWLVNVGISVGEYSALCQNIGVKEKFELSDFVDVLNEIQTDTNEKDTKELDSSTLTVCLELIKEIAKCLDRDETLIRCIKPENLYIPDSKGILRPCTQICFIDHSTDPHLEIEEDIYPAHEDLSLRTDKLLTKLGVRNLTQHIVDRSSEEIGDPFGQEEPLTRRIKSLLDSYPRDAGILKEMVQNADDAKATKIHFILDERSHPTNYLFCESWKHLQGPALIIYNDATFTEKDLLGIKNLGLGSKSTDPTQTGQYGVGFNCVYHLTDTPTFKTTVKGRGEVLVAFDPNLHYVRGATKAEPGKLYKQELFSRFPNVACAYDLKQFGEEYSSGTLFRLPLRNSDQASTSEISNYAPTKEDVLGLLEEFQSESHNIPFFLNNLKEIGISRIDELTGKHTPLYKIEFSLSKEDENKKLQFYSDIRADVVARKDPESKSSKPFESIERKEVSITMQLRDSKGLDEQWAILESFGFSEDGYDEVTESSINGAYADGNMNLMPRGGVAALISSNRVRHSERYFYSFLPLPQPSYIPVHVNGHFALDHESRRALWKEKNRSFRSEWNSLVMKYVIAPSYATLLLELQNIIVGVSPGTQSPIRQENKLKTKQVTYGFNRNEIETSLNQYNHVFPIVFTENAMDNYLGLLVKALYERFDKLHLPVLPVFWMPRPEQLVLDWFPPTAYEDKAAVFDSLELKHDMHINETDEMGQRRMQKQEQLKEALVNCGYCVFAIRLGLFNTFKHQGVNMLQNSSEHIMQFFKNYKSKGNTCLLKDLPVSLSKTVAKKPQNVALILQYISQCEEFSQSLLNKVPLLITVDGILREFSEGSSVFDSEFHDLFPERKEEFLNPHLSYAVNWFKDVENQVVRPFEMKDFAAMVSAEYPHLLSDKKYVPWTEDLNISSHWLSRFWKFVHHCSDKYKHTTTVKDLHVTYEDVYKSTVEPIANWNLLPGFRGNSDFLVKIGSPFLLVDLQQYHLSVKPLVDALQMLNLPQVNTFVIEGRNEGKATYGYVPKYNKYLRGSVATISKPDLFLDSLDNWVQSEFYYQVDFGGNHEPILSFFASHRSVIEQKEARITAVRKMPVYQLIDNKTQALTKSAIIVPYTIHKQGLETLSEKLDCLFLKYPFQTDHRELLKVLGCHLDSEYDFYANYLVPNWLDFADSQKWNHIQNIVELWRKPNKSEQESTAWRSLISLLKDTAILPSQKNGLQKANYFVDWDEPVFQHFMTEKFAPNPPNTVQIQMRDWLPFLRDIGMQCIVTSDMLISFARKIEQDSEKASKQNFSKMKEGAEIIINHLYYKSEYSFSLVEQIKKINFIPLDRISDARIDIHEQFAMTPSGLTSLENGAVQLRQKESLVWTSMKLLPYWVEPRGSHFDSWKIAEKRKPILQNNLDLHIGEVPLNKVIDNLRSISLKMFKRMQNESLQNKVKRSLEDVLKVTYEHLDKNKQSEELQRIKDCPCVLMDDGNQLVKPGQTTVDLKEEDQIIPYLYRIPLKYGAYMDLFRKLGTSEKPSVMQYQDVLSQFYNKYPSQLITEPNDAQKVHKALFSLMVLFRTKNGGEAKNILFVPSAAGYMKSSKELCYIDYVSIKNRVDALQEDLLSPFGNMKEIKTITKKPEWELFSEKQEKVFETFPDTIRPKRLSAFIKEKALHNEHLQEQTDFASELARRFGSAQFLKAFRRILINAEFTEQNINKTIKNAQECEVVSVCELKTQLYFKDSLVANSDKDVPCLLLANEDRWILYISCNPKQEKKIHLMLSCKINKQMLSGKLDEKLLDAILQGDLDELGDLLDNFHVDSIDDDFVTLPSCGTFIPLEYHHLLCQAIHPFHKDDFVGLELPTDDDNAEPIYIYAKIIREVSSKDSEVLDKEYEVNVGNGQTIVVSILDLLRFYNEREIFSGALVKSEATSTDTDANKYKSLEKVKEEIKKILVAAFSKDEQSRKKIIRRLLREWHPDKNPDNTEFCTEVCKYIQFLISKLENGEPLDDEHSGATFRNFKDTFRSGGNFSSFYSTFFNTTGSWARRQRSNRQTYREDFRDNMGSSSRSYHGGPPPTSCRRNPQPAEARRWMQQAKCDLHAAPTDMGRTEAAVFGLCDGNYEWVCYKSHQAAEKALKAGQYAIDANSVFRPHHLGNNAAPLDDSTLQAKATQLEGLVGSSSRMRYPDQVSYATIPHRAYDRHTALKAQELAREIVELCDNFIMMKS